MPICFRLLVHWVRRAASLADWTAGSKSAINTAMIAMTTSSSISVKARYRCMRTSSSCADFARSELPQPWPEQLLRLRRIDDRERTLTQPAPVGPAVLDRDSRE